MSKAKDTEIKRNTTDTHTTSSVGGELENLRISAKNLQVHGKHPESTSQTSPAPTRSDGQTQPLFGSAPSDLTENHPSQRLRYWLTPGLRVKRWIATFLVASVLAALGLLLFFFNSPLTPVMSRLATKLHALLLAEMLWPWLLSVLLVLVALGLGWYSILQMNRAVLRGLGAVPEDVAREVQTRYQLSRGPRVVAIGGGTGLSTLLSGLRVHTGNITALVTVADDGGSSGRLRQSLDMVAPGDLTDCYAALSKSPALAELLLHRFERGEGLEGHTFGNLLLATLSEQRGGLAPAVHDLHEMLRVQGQVLPATTQPVTLLAHLNDGRTVHGESRLATELGAATVQRVELQPARPPALTEAVAAIREAELIVLGPGSLFTSILPVLLVPELARAIRSSRAQLMYVAALMTEPGETDRLSLADHDRLITEHLGRAVDTVLVNSAPLPERAIAAYRNSGAQPLNTSPHGKLTRNRLVAQPLLAATTDNQVRHDSHKVAGAILSMVQRP